MRETLLNTAYSPEIFRKEGHRLIETLAAHLESVQTGKSQKVLQWQPPQDEHLYWQEYLKNGAGDAFFDSLIGHSIHVHHLRYMGHQVCPPVPLAALAGLASSLLNNGMAVYEMGMASSAIERIITDLLCEKAGYGPTSRGILTSGGTLANLTALLSARKAKAKGDVWNSGSTEQLGIMVSEEAHYCVDRAARIMGLGENGIIKIPVTKDYTIDVLLLEASYQKAAASGISVFAIVGSAPTTATGIFDDLEAIAKFSQIHDLWFHVDAAHGGAAILAPKYRHTLRGLEQADSFVVDGHKMLMMPALTTALLYKDGENSHLTFSQKADYLLIHSDEEDWYNLAKRTFECTKKMMSIQWFAILKYYGWEIFDNYVTYLYDLGATLGNIIRGDASFELAVDPMCNIVCFRYVEESLTLAALNELNEHIRTNLLQEGTYYIVQTKLRGIHYLRMTLMNPFTSITQLQEVLQLIKELAVSLQNKSRS